VLSGITLVVNLFQSLQISCGNGGCTVSPVTEGDGDVINSRRSSVVERRSSLPVRVRRTSSEGNISTIAVWSPPDNRRKISLRPESYVGEDIVLEINPEHHRRLSEQLHRRPGYVVRTRSERVSSTPPRRPSGAQDSIPSPD
jgi:hypothetical protein